MAHLMIVAVKSPTSRQAHANVYIRGVKLVSVQGPIQANLISSGLDQCNHCI